jgi:hypothetical protein
VEAIEDPVSNPPWFKKLIALTTEKGREREGHFLGEGVHVVDELVSHHREIRYYVGRTWSKGFKRRELD